MFRCSFWPESIDIATKSSEAISVKTPISSSRLFLCFDDLSLSNPPPPSPSSSPNDETLTNEDDIHAINFVTTSTRESDARQLTTFRHDVGSRRGHELKQRLYKMSVNRRQSFSEVIIVDVFVHKYLYRAENIQNTLLKERCFSQLNIQ